MAKSRQKPTTKGSCKKYGIAITNYVLGEDLQMPPEELYHHLRDCPKCRAELEDWQDTYAVMRTEAYHQKPEAKQKYQELLAKIRQLPACASADRPVAPVKTIQGKQPIDDERELGSAAGKIYQVLKENGETPYPVLRDKTGLVNYPFYEAIGWLSREKKIRRARDKQTFYASLQSGA